MNSLFMAVRNLKKNFSFYSLYLISAALVIAVYFAFTSFSVNTVMLEKISADGRRGNNVYGHLRIFNDIRTVLHDILQSFLFTQKNKRIGNLCFHGLSKSIEPFPVNF